MVAWWAPTSNTPHGGLHRLLFGRQPGTAEVPGEQGVGDDDYAARILGLIEELGGPAAEVTEVVPTEPVATAGGTAELAVRRFERGVDTEWRRTSYSGLIRADETAVAGDVTSRSRRGATTSPAGPRSRSVSTSTHPRR